MKRYPTARPSLGKKEEKYVLQALRSGTLSIGPFVERFEKEFARRIGTRFACAVSSGTAGLHLALVAAEIKEGDEVITSPFSFVASANAILYVGAKPVFVDIDEHTYNIDPKKIESRITEKTRAILPVHIFGQSADMKPIMAIARTHKLAVIEDACESLLAKYGDKNVGTFGQSGVFAFYPNKQMTTGEGGMIVTDDPGLDAQYRSLRNQGRAPDARWLGHDRLGYNYRLDELSSAVGVAQMEKIDFLVKERQKVAQWYGQALAPLSDRIIMPETAPESTHTWFVYVIRLRNEKIDRDSVIEDLEKAGMYCKPYLPSIHLFGFYRERFGFKPGDFPVSEAVSGSTIALPFYIGLNKRDVVYIVRVLEETLAKHEKRHI